MAYFNFLALICVIVLFEGMAHAQKAGDLDFYRDLAEYHSPLAIHEVGKMPKADIPTNFDFDGDVYSDNNWENLEFYPVDPAVYYEVIETTTHYFVTYAFYHPRDYSYVCVPIVCHENDLEGTILTIQKNGSRFGKLIFAEALAHIGITSAKKPLMFYTFNNKTGQFIQRIAIRIQDMGHGIYFWNGDWPKRYEIYLANDDSNISRLPKAPLRYALIPLRFFWDLRNHRESDRIIESRFDFKGPRFSLPNIPSRFLSKKFGSGKVSFPWGWGVGGKKRGEWFLDPAFWVYNKLKNPSEFSLEYIYHPYLADKSGD